MVKHAINEKLLLQIFFQKFNWGSFGMVVPIRNKPSKYIEGSGSSIFMIILTQVRNCFESRNPFKTWERILKRATKIMPINGGT